MSRILMPRWKSLIIGCVVLISSSICHADKPTIGDAISFLNDTLPQCGSTAMKNGRTAKASIDSVNISKGDATYRFLITANNWDKNSVWTDGVEATYAFRLAELDPTPDFFENQGLKLFRFNCTKSACVSTAGRSVKKGVESIASSQQNFIAAPNCIENGQGERIVRAFSFAIKAAGGKASAF